MAPSSRDRLSVDLHDLKAALFERAQSLGVSPSGLVRTTLAEVLGRLDPADIDRSMPSLKAGNGDRVRLCLRMSRAQASATLDGARRAGLNPGDYVGGLVAGVPVLLSAGSQTDHLAALIASSAELSTFTFRAVEAKRHQRSPSVTPARIVNSPTLLTGLLRCANCGAGMTLATGKGGRYRYYKCNTRIGQSIGACSTSAVPVAKLDRAVLTALADKVLTPQRLKEMLRELKARLRKTQAGHDDQVRGLQRELAELELATNRLFEAVEKGSLPMDEMLSARAQKLKAKRDAVLIEISGAKRAKEMPVSALSASHVEAFGTALRARVLDTAGGFPKRYLRQFVSEI